MRIEAYEEIAPRTIFNQLSTAEKEAIYRQCDRVHPQDGLSLNAKDRVRHFRAGLRVGK